MYDIQYVSATSVLILSVKLSKAENKEKIKAEAKIRENLGTGCTPLTVPPRGYAPAATLPSALRYRTAFPTDAPTEDKPLERHFQKKSCGKIPYAS